MAVASVAWADEVVYKTALFGANYNSQSVSGYTTTWTATNDGFTVTLENFNNNGNGWDFVKCGRKNNASVATITTGVIDEAITKVDVTIDAITAAKVNSIKLYISSDNSNWDEAGSFDKSTGAKTVTLANPAADLYYKIEFDCASGSSNGLVTVSKVELYYDDSATPSTNPSISAENVNIAYDATGGEIAYSITNPVTGTSLEATTTADWISNINVTADAVTFDATQNETSAERVATFTLTYENAANKTVTVTQAGNPNVFNRIEEISATGQNYVVKGTVVATSARGFVIGDGTGYVYTYLGTAPSYSVGDMVKISGTTGTYGNVIQFTSAATFEAATDSEYTPLTPAAMDEVPNYTEGLHLSDYYQFEGKLTKTTSGNYTNYEVAVGDSKVRISYPNTAQTTELEALLNKTVRVKGFFAGNSSSTFTAVMESVEEVVSDEPEIQIADDELQLGSGANDNGTFNVTYTNEFVPVAAFAQLYNDADCTEEFDGDWIMVEESMDEDPSVITYVVEANTATTERSVYLYVEAMDNDANIISNVFTITQAAYEAPKFTWDLTTNSYSSESEDLVTWSSDFATMKNAKGGSTTAANNYLGGTYNHTRFYKNQKITFTPKSGYAVTSIVINAITSYVNGFNGEDAWTNATVSVNGTVITVTPTNINLPVSVTISAACRATGVTVSYVESDVVAITIKEGFSATTFSCDKALDFTGKNIAAYIITDENGATTQVWKVPANTGLYIERGDTEGTISYDIPFLTNEADAEKITGNLLVGTISEPVNTKTLEGNYTYYLFGKQNGKEAFFKVGESTPDAKATASAGKAYLAVPGAGNAKEMIVIGGDVTGIESIENGTIVNDNYYTIDGKLVKGQPTQKGIYVVNGRKVVIK